MRMTKDLFNLISSYGDDCSIEIIEVSIADMTASVHMEFIEDKFLIQKLRKKHIDLDRLL